MHLPVQRQELDITQLRKAQVALSASVLLATTVVTGALTTGSAAARVARDATETNGQLTALNNSGIAGHTEAVVNGRRVSFDVDARRCSRACRTRSTSPRGAGPPRVPRFSASS